MICNAQETIGRSPSARNKEEKKMMDLILIGILLGSFGLIKLFADFCESQIKTKKNETNRER